ncbi:hypothetical protein EX30DRAFT_338950 [Ascodesmis nigricans]|uniref:DUF1770-domain-containing protein n=1 Tax=Ascodesmis nigricans TaxID=341454 RepID=A0A4V3SJL5_9PEZI|nr:hypothetical protein EX30DRAFT_338950 [Ascodesmis nigricans]
MSTSNPAAFLAETLIQDTHLTSRPSTQPPTAADSLQTVPPESSPSYPSYPYRPLDLDVDSSDTASISSSILRPSSAYGHYRQPLPDLRFEQSYLASIAPAQGVWWKIALITLKDQVLLAFLQGFGFKLVTLGWRRWNTAVRFAGNGMGARIRRWWWEVNNWEIPKTEGAR